MSKTHTVTNIGADQKISKKALGRSNETPSPEFPKKKEKKLCQCYARQRFR